jgi:hypothetical protein
MSALRLIHGAAFDAETTQLLGSAYDKAVLGFDDVFQREIIAMRIIEAARRGERDIDRLVAYALAGLDGATEAAG